MRVNHPGPSTRTQCLASALLLISTLASQSTAALGQRPDTSTYASALVRQLVTTAAARNVLPPALRGYRADATTEIGTMVVDASGVEATYATEQVRSQLEWRANGRLEQRIAGYRSAAVVPQMSTLSVVRMPWLLPVLYGNRMDLFLIGANGADTSASRAGAVHPLASDRARYYRFFGGDTTARMRVGSRELSIITIRVMPRENLSSRLTVFSGDLLLDARRGVLVGIRGEIVQHSPKGAFARLAAMSGLTGVAFIDARCEELEGAFWVPSYQRIDLYATWSSGTNAKAAVRFVSRIRRFALDTSSSLLADSLQRSLARQRRLLFAPDDSLTRDFAWPSFGTLLARTNVRDFSDVAPDEWRLDGRPSTRLRVTRAAEVLHFNRVEGAFTGWGVEHRFRDAWPGVSARLAAGWAWAERTARGELVATKEGTGRVEIRAGRVLETTNDFRPPRDSGSPLSAVLLGRDDHDYVDRQQLLVAWRRSPTDGGLSLHADFGRVRDDGVQRSVRAGPFVHDSAFRENRGVHDGSYSRMRLGIGWRPQVGVLLTSPGIGGLLSIEHAVGGLAYTRLDARVSGRRERGAIALAVRADGALAIGPHVPPQQLIELGAVEGLEAYRYKDFAGDRAFLVRAVAMRRLPFWQAPSRIGGLVVPPVAPALSVDLAAGWTGFAAKGSRDASLPLDPRGARPTGGIRGSITFGARAFGGAVGLGVSRSFEQGQWRLRALVNSFY